MTKENLRKAVLDSIRAHKAVQNLFMPLCYFDFFNEQPGYKGLDSEPREAADGKLSCAELEFRTRFYRAIPAVFLDWCARRSFTTERDASVKETARSEGRLTVTTYDTPVGTLREARADWYKDFNAVYVAEPMLKTPADARVYRYILDATRIVNLSDYGKKWLAVTGDSGICGHAGLCAPFHELLHLYGPENFLLITADGLPPVIRDLYDALWKAALNRCNLMARGPFEVFDMESTWDVGVISPGIYREHYVPFIRDCAAIIHAAGKVCMDHASGQKIDRFLDGMLESGLDMIYGLTIDENNAPELVAMARRCEGKLLPCLGLCPMRLWESSLDEIRARCEKILKAANGRSLLFGTADATVAATEPAKLALVASMLCGAA